MMQDERFEEFMILISGIYRNLQKLKSQRTEELGLKQVHIFWVYLLDHHPEGMTASELARASGIDRSLISREIDGLVSKGYLKTTTQSDQRRYGLRYVLTEQGKETAQEISRVAARVQTEVDKGISEAELDSFYRTLRILQRNFDAYAKGNKNER